MPPFINLSSVILRHGWEPITRWLAVNHPINKEVFLERLYTELGIIVEEIEETKSHRTEDSEDRLTVDIMLLLRKVGYRADHDPDTNGHVDLRVNQGRFIWLGEAKIHRSYDWLREGLDQLLLRYATGREAGSGLLIYIKGQNAQAVIDEWRSRLAGGSFCGLTNIENIPDDTLSFWSIHTHQASGIEVRTKHIGVALYVAPQSDRSGSQ